MITICDLVLQIFWQGLVLVNPATSFDRTVWPLLGQTLRLRTVCRAKWKTRTPTGMFEAMIHQVFLLVVSLQGFWERVNLRPDPNVCAQCDSPRHGLMLWPNSCEIRQSDWHIGLVMAPVWFWHLLASGAWTSPPLVPSQRLEWPVSGRLKVDLMLSSFWKKSRFDPCENELGHVGPTCCGFGMWRLACWPKHTFTPAGSSRPCWAISVPIRCWISRATCKKFDAFIDGCLSKADSESRNQLWKPIAKDCAVMLAWCAMTITIYHYMNNANRWNYESVERCSKALTGTVADSSQQGGQRGWREMTSSTLIVVWYDADKCSS